MKPITVHEAAEAELREASLRANCRKADLPPSGMRHDEMLKA